MLTVIERVLLFSLAIQNSSIEILEFLTILLYLSILTVVFSAVSLKSELHENNIKDKTPNKTNNFLIKMKLRPTIGFNYKTQIVSCVQIYKEK